MAKAYALRSSAIDTVNRSCQPVAISAFREQCEAVLCSLSKSGPQPLSSFLRLVDSYSSNPYRETVSRNLVRIISFLESHDWVVYEYNADLTPMVRLTTEGGALIEVTE